MGKMFLVLIDGWMCTQYVLLTLTVKFCVGTIFASHGLPEIFVSDNGTAFTSSEFGIFLRQNGIRHITSTPYYPATNGLA